MQKKLIFFIKKNHSMQGWGYPNPSRMGMGFNFSFTLGMGRVMSKYMRNGYGDREGKTCPHPTPLPCLPTTSQINKPTKLTNENKKDEKYLKTYISGQTSFRRSKRLKGRHKCRKPALCKPTRSNC